ncbi:TPR_REGION domain-containing protein [Trichonephila clavata]|uniref:TPR_REGION domain-containing protein n=1 Tax=Trichonephila clavata TaxID=2740835 RepID=A0A8X6LGX2_TRICU|nr:TPR_REGION domain-containing protein [Trichonephila clavata]
MFKSIASGSIGEKRDSKFSLGPIRASNLNTTMKTLWMLKSIDINNGGSAYISEKDVSPSECEQCLIKASEIYDDVGRGKTAAKQHMSLAEQYEEHGNLQRAVDEYQKAADMFKAEVSTYLVLFK